MPAPSGYTGPSSSDGKQVARQRTAAPHRRPWSPPQIDSIHLADETGGGAAPKNNENPNFYVS